MSRLVHCLEPTGRPHRVTLPLDDQERRFCVYLLTEPRAGGLRRTVLRRPDAPPPDAGALLLELELRRSRPTGPEDAAALALFPRVVGPWEVLDVVGERRSRLSPGVALEGGGRLHVLLPEREIRLKIEVQEVVEQGTDESVLGQLAEGDALVADLSAMIWAVPTATAALKAPWTRVIAAFKGLAKKLRLSPALLTPLLMAGTVALGMGYATWSQHRRAEKAEELLTTRESELAQSQARAEAARAGEGACLAARGTLASRLGDLEAARAVQVEDTLQRTRTREVAVTAGGTRMQSDALDGFDESSWEAIIALVVQRMGEVAVEPGLVTACTDQAEVLDQDIPAFALLWHPDAQKLCPDGYRDVDGAVDRAGRWGLSARAAAIYGDQFNAVDDAGDASAETDKRLRERWAAAAHVSGVRHTLRGLLGAPTGARPPVAPSSAALWAVALWDAYNHLPEVPEGAPLARSEDCAVEVVLTVAGAQDAADPGLPVLPDLALVAEEGIPGLAPTAACPWPRESVQQGAVRALLAVARAARLAEATAAEQGE